MNILFICTHNRCRSILAEAIANHVGEGLITAASAGSEPAGSIHPMTLECLRQHKIPVTRLASKSWDEMADFGADFIITVCDSAAKERCPVWFGKALKIHWSIADPSAIADQAAMAQAFDDTVALLTYRIVELRELLKGDPDRTALIHRMEALDKETPPGK